MKLILGDCLEKLKEIPDNSVDSIVTDPPYGLSQPSKRNVRSLGGAMLEVILPDLANLYTKTLGDADLPFPRDSVLFLDWALRSVGVKSGVTMPESPVDLNSDAVFGKKEIKTTGESSVCASNRVLVDKVESAQNELLGEYVLNFRPLGHSAFSDCESIGLRQFGSGCFSVPVVVPENSGLATFLLTKTHGLATRLTDYIGICNDTAAQPKAPPDIMAGSATELVFVFSFDPTAGTCEVLPASGASQLNLIAELVSTKFITTSAATSGLSPMFKTIAVGLVGDAAGGTFTVNFHREFLSSLIYSRGGFMGKKWDYDVPSEDIWRECLRVLKPGGHLLAFAGTRTQHRMAVRIEDAGFEIRDMIAWVYGCLSDDTNIVTPFGEKSYTTIKTGDLVLCYDKYNKEYSYQPVEEVYEYNIKDTAYRIQSDYTDQVVSRNHRCLVERDGREIFIFAEDLEAQENIPFLEDLPRLQSTISDSYSRASNEEQNLFEGVQEPNNWFQKLWKQTLGRAFWYCTSDLYSMRNYILSQPKAFEASEKSSMFLPMQWGFAGGGMETTCSQRTKKLVSRIGTSISATNDRRYKPQLEGRNNIQEIKRKSQRSKVCSLPTGIFGYGEERWLHNGTSVVDGTTSGEIVNSSGSSASYKSQCTGQSDRESDVVCIKQGTQTIREWSGHKTTLATITPFEYEGKIWCVKVPTGSFVATRNGKAFTTGNSGFPKSLDVSKAIDKAAGVEREVLSEVKTNSGGMAHISKTNAEQGYRPSAYAGHSFDDSAKNVIKITAPATDEAKQFAGWGTALKPALEPITVARKPLIGTVAQNVLEYGTGGLNIDGCRVEGTPEPTRFNPAKHSHEGWRMNATGTECAANASQLGRWPANLIHDGSDEVLELFPEAKSGTSNGNAPVGESGDNIPLRRGTLISRNDTGSAARFFYCAKTSKKDRGENNNHPTVKPTNLMRYLCRLVTPPNGTVLDPFMGSGSTGKAAMLENFDFIGIERDEGYFEIAKNRIEHAKNLDNHCEEEPKSSPTSSSNTQFGDLFE